VLGATIEEYIQASWPFLFVTILAIFLVIFFPQIVLFIPNLIFG
jgi:TRAP-type C4-dicarboxylate transport system permease large subunit